MYEAYAVGPQIIFGFLVFWFLVFGFLIVSYPGLSSAVQGFQGLERENRHLPAPKFKEIATDACQDINSCCALIRCLHVIFPT